VASTGWTGGLARDCLFWSLGPMLFLRAAGDVLRSREGEGRSRGFGFGAEVEAWVLPARFSLDGAARTEADRGTGRRENRGIPLGRAAVCFSSMTQEARGSRHAALIEIGWCTDYGFAS